MTRSKRLGELIGPALVALAVTEIINLNIWATTIAPVTYLNGSILFVAGLAIVRAHNIWTTRWPVLITLTGWVLTVGGLYRMAVPRAPQAPDVPATYVGLALLGAFGVFLTIKAYAAPSEG